MTSLAAARTHASRRVILTDLLGDSVTTAISWVEFREGYLAAYNPRRISYDDAADILHHLLGAVQIESAVTEAQQ
jgi:hypothetical protein